jgi:hypothetical protein
MSVQLAESDARPTPNQGRMTATPAHTARILSDDIGWLSRRIAELEAAGGAGERRLALCYENLLRQRRRQLTDLNDSAAGCWQDYLC